MFHGKRTLDLEESQRLQKTTPTTHMSRCPDPDTDTDTMLSKRAVPRKLHIDDTKTKPLPGTNEPNRRPAVAAARAHNGQCDVMKTGRRIRAAGSEGSSGIAWVGFGEEGRSDDPGARESGQPDSSGKERGQHTWEGYHRGTFSSLDWSAADGTTDGRVGTCSRVG